jgi:2-oxoglutarate dehydrogenase dihydrolipoamide succinyltransferase (E2 component)
VSSLPTDNGAAQSADISSVEVTMPQMGVSVAEGTVVAWHKRVGDWVNADEALCEISTDKVDTEIPSPASGRVLEILAEVEQTVLVGEVLARIGTDAVAGEPHPDEHVAPVAADERNGAVQPPDEHVARIAADERNGADQPAAGAHHSPVVQRIARSEGVDLAKVTGTGRGGRVRKQDVLAYIEHPSEDEPPPLHSDSPYREEEAQAAPAPGMQADAGLATGAPNAEGPERLSRMRRSIAEHMVRSLQLAAHCTSVIEVDMSALEDERATLRLSYLPFVARCAIDALQAHPSLNATLEGEQLTRHRSVNLGIAVSLGDDGLIVPVIHQAQELSHQGLASHIAGAAERARAGKLSPEEVHGGTFTITNPGGYGTLISTPIINQPQVAILDLEAVVKRPVVVSDAAGRESIAIRPMAYLCLSWDHRALDGALAAQFLSTLRGRIEKWGGS